ncbi:polysaccharide biosynthesis/export family protein [Flavobacterium sp. SUN052]|uniref:polysaccharide biosynthesis/export family protein n=1 Tax=Flavobacterium sp. SUN052 TaxID=3002441 RepID=UPI00239633DC|nr:polysaccharide biosynthesis/export family protein [Flavobacterium sp. SUN052]MEC4005499.1 polysaccharide biosynthesis/export family protein [Flavobacterium sp. SUN052]
MALSLTSCATKKEVIYFSESIAQDQNKIDFIANKIQSNDLLSIIISSTSPELALPYNLYQNETSNNGYLVNTEGLITMPVLGKIKVKDLTLTALEDILEKKLKDENHLSNSVVTVRLLNAKFTILGEVNKPGTYNFSEENISILQAIGYGGDLTINGKRTNVLIIREVNNIKTYTTIDLTSKKWFSSDVYYIKPNDVIYVNPNGAKVKQAGYIGTLGTFMAAVSVGLSTILTIIVLSK